MSRSFHATVSKNVVVMFDVNVVNLRFHCTMSRLYIIIIYKTKQLYVLAGSKEKYLTVSKD